MNKNVSIILSLLITLFLVTIGTGMDDTSNVSNITTDPNVTYTPVPTVTPNVTTPNPTPYPNTTSPTPTITPNVTVQPNITSPIPTETPIVIAPNVTSTTVPTSNTTVVSITPRVNSGHKQRTTPTSTPLPTTVVIPNVIIVQNTPGQQETTWYGDIYDKVAIAAVLGFIGLIYEIIKVKYEHKKKNELEKPKEPKR